MASETLTEMVRARLAELSRERRFSQTKVAKRLGVDPSAVNRTIHGPKEITLVELEVIADEANVQVAELIAPPGTLKQVRPDEAELLRYVRMWPKSVSVALLEFLRFFADESPAETQTRNVHEFWRRMGPRERPWVYGVLQMVREGILTPDLREALAAQLEAETRLRRAGGAKKPPKADET